MRVLMAFVFAFSFAVSAHAAKARGTASLDGQQGTENLSATPGHNVRVECKLVCPPNIGQGTQNQSVQACQCAPGSVHVATNACPEGKTLSYGPAPYSDADNNYYVWTCR